ncbi:MAG: O-methyltransferase [Bacteroidales bacterium]
MIDRVAQYANRLSFPLPEVLEWLERESYLRSNQIRMLSGPIVGRFLINFSKILAPKKILEIGTFTGYSAICLAQALPPGGKLVTVEKNREHLSLIEEALRRASLSDRVEVVIGNAIEYLQRGKIEEEVWDLVYIDANKREYVEYYNLVMPQLKSGGYIIADNALWSGKVVDGNGGKEIDRQGSSIELFNKMVFEDKRVESFILPLRDGLNIIRKLEH